MSNQEKWLTLVDYFISIYGGDWDEKTYNWYHARLRHLVDFAVERGIKAKKINGADLNQFKGLLLRKEFSYSTRKGTLGAAKTFLTWLHRKGKIKCNPFFDLDYRPPRKEKTVIMPVATHEARQMIRAAEADESVAGKRDAAIMRLMLTSGLRRKEVVNLSTSDIDYHHNLITVRKGGKYNNQRLVPLKVTTKVALEEWLKVRPAPQDGNWLFIRLDQSKDKHKQMKPRAIARVVQKWAEKAGVRVSGAISPHKWRHAFATALSRGKNPFGLQRVMGHSDIATTNEYVYYATGELTDLVEDFAPDIDDDEAHEFDS